MQLDHSAQQALQEARWPEHRAAALQRLVDFGVEVQDVLAAAAVAPGPMDAATRYWAHKALIQQVSVQDSEAVSQAQATGGLSNDTEELLKWELRLVRMLLNVYDRCWLWLGPIPDLLRCQVVCTSWSVCRPVMSIV